VTIKLLYFESNWRLALKHKQNKLKVTFGLSVSKL